MLWKDISTAPKARDILVYCGEGWQPWIIARWNDEAGEWQTDMRIGFHPRHPPTHWAELTRPD